MKTLFLLIAALASLSPLARADIPPARIIPVRTERPAPDGAVAAVTALADAIRASDEAAAKAVVDARGWAENLVGGSGTKVADLFAQGARKRWAPKANWGSRAFFGDHAVMVTAALKGLDDERTADVVFALLVEVDGAWRLLGTGENEVEVRALGRRFQAGEPLAPKRAD